MSQRELRLVFPSLAGNEYRTQGEYRTPFERALRGAGVTRHVRLHDCRHTWASRHVEVGTPPEVLRKLGGWSSLAMVQWYGHASDAAMEAAQEAIGKLAMAKRKGSF